MADQSDWTRREKVWADVLATEILARKAAEAALREAIEGRFVLDTHPQVKYLGQIIEDANKTLDALEVPRGEALDGNDMIMRSLTLEERILYLASQMVQWPKD